MAMSGPSPVAVRDRGDHRRHLMDLRRLVVALYAAVAAGLVPWMVALYMSQPETATAHHLHLVAGGILLLVAAGLGATGLGWRRDSPLTAPAAAFTGTVAAITAWFLTVTAPPGALGAALALALVVLVPVVATGAWVLRQLFGPHTQGPRHRRRAANAVLVWGSFLVPLAVVVGVVTAQTRTANHLPLVWTGLDALEVAGAATTAWFLARRSPLVAVAGSVTAALLVSDAWFNVMATTGQAQLMALVLALGEIPLAALSLAVAYRAVATWRGARSPSAPAPDPRATQRSAASMVPAARRRHMVLGPLTLPDGHGKTPQDTDGGVGAGGGSGGGGIPALWHR